MFGIDDLAVATLGSGIISGISNLFGANKQSKAQESANRANLQIAREQNALNQSMLNQQQNFAVRTWEMQNEYNDPSAVSQRLREAGINPAAVFGAGTTQSAGGISNPSGLPAAGAHMEAPDVGQFYNQVGASVHNAVNAYFQARLLNEQVKKAQSETHHQQIVNQLDEQSLQWDLMRRANDARLTKTQRLQAQRDLEFFNEVKNYRVLGEKNTAAIGEKQVEELQVRIATQKLEQEILRTNAKWQDRLNAASYNSLCAGISQALSAARLNDASAVESAARKAVAEAQEAGLKLDNEQKRELKDAIVDKAWYEAEEMLWKGANEHKKFGQGVFQFAPSTPGQDRSVENRRRRAPSKNSETGLQPYIDW